MNPKEYLTQYAKLEDDEIEKTFSRIEMELKWIGEVFLLTSKFEKITLNFLPIKWRISLALSQTVIKEIHLCFLSILRKHISQSMSNMRVAIEAAGFINAIRDNEERGGIWLQREFGDINNKSYQDLEKLRWSSEIGSELKIRFRSASEQSHANLIKTLFWIQSQTQKRQGKTVIIDKFSFFDNPQPPEWIITCIHWLIDTSFVILLLFTEVFKEHLREIEFEESLREKYIKYKDYVKDNFDYISITPKLKNHS